MLTPLLVVVVAGGKLPYAADTSEDSRQQPSSATAAMPVSADDSIL